MSRLYVNDLENIKNGKIIRLNYETKTDYKEKVSLETKI